MRTFLRGLAASALALGVLWAASAPASATPSTDPCEQTDTYIPSPGCAMQVSHAQAVCTDDGTSAVLTYTVTSQVPSGSVRITITDGASTSQTTGSMDGSVAWPEEVGAGPATVTFTTTTYPAYTTSVTVTAPECASGVLVSDPKTTPTPGPSQPAASGGGSSGGSAVLAATGSQVGPMVGLATGLMILGGLIYLASRRRTV
ncbi:MAG: hypothetical protein FWD18_07245 [Micrococcales bacterium]|nr:hypothetical protein [Micrococcales bacterium]